MTQDPVFPRAEKPYKASVMIVDDNPINLRVLAGMLNENGYQVRPATSGGLALRSLQSSLPDLILLDIRMPELDGYEVCRQLKAEERTREIPVIFISALDEPVDKVKAFAVGGVDYVTKPFQVEEVLARIQTHLTICELQHHLRQQNAQLQKEIAMRQEQERMLIQQSKLAAMGEMIGNIAHQWRQPLTALGVLIQDAEDAYTFGELDGPYLKKMVEDSMRLIQRMSTTINDFRNFFMPGKQKEHFLVSRAVEDALSIIHASLRNHDITITTEIVQDSEIYAYRNEYAQVLLNILSNAKDALLTRQPPDKRITILIEQTPAGQSRVSVSDNGGGIDGDIFDKIFDPYFTTKFKADGIGIGLYMAKTIIERNMHGNIHAENIPDGAKFVIDV